MKNGHAMLGPIGKTKPWHTAIKLKSQDLFFSLAFENSLHEKVKSIRTLFEQ